jgi:hypothetical protein
MENFERDINGIEEGDEIDILAPVEVKEDGEIKTRRRTVMTLTKVNGKIEVTDTSRYFDQISTEVNTPINNVDLKNAKNITDVISNVDLVNAINVALEWNTEKTNAFLTTLVSKIE